MCPRQFHKIMWWEAITFTESGHVTAVQDCPYGAVGKNSNPSSLYHNWYLFIWLPIPFASMAFRQSVLVADDFFKWMLLHLGDAKRNCSKTELWSEPDLFNCTNKDFVSLESQVWDWENIKWIFEGISQTFVSFRKVIDIFFKFLLISNWLKRLKLLLHTFWSNLLGFKK